MKSLEELQALFQELDEAYNTVIKAEVPYDSTTVSYAKKCRDDAYNLLQYFTEKDKNETQ